MGLLDVILGGNQKSGGGGMSKIGLALIALMLWRWYQSAGHGGAEAPAPAPSPRGGVPLPKESAPQIPAPGSGRPDDSDFGPLVDSTRNMPSGGGRRGRPRYDEDEEEGGGPAGGPGSGLGDILNDILRGGLGGGGRGGPEGGGGGGMGDILNDILRGGAGGRGGQGGGGGGGLGDILGQVLGGGRGMPGARAMGEAPDPLGELLRGAGIGGLGGLLAGGAGGGALGDLMRQFEQAGHGDAAQSWVSRDQNIPVTPSDIEKTFGSDIINQLADQFGLDKKELLQGLSEVMPETINKLTPEGRLPTEQDIANWR